MEREKPNPWLLSGLYAGMVLAWGLNFIFVKIGLASSPPLWFAALRGLLATAGVTAGLLAQRAPTSMGIRERRDALLLGLPTTGLFFGLWFSAATRVPAGETAVLIYTFPLWVVILSFLLLRENPGRLAWAGVTIGFVGVILVEQPWNGTGESIPPIAVAELLGAAAAWAVGTIFLKSRIPGHALRTANAYQLLSGSAVLLVAAAAFEPHPTIDVTGPFVASLLWLGLIGTALANAIWFVLLKRFSAPTVSTWAFLTPVVALAASVLIFSETLATVQLLGVALVLASAIAAARTSTAVPARYA
jgi:drug/metabolite transporter (DMT)-like permease